DSHGSSRAFRAGTIGTSTCCEQVARSSAMSVTHPIRTAKSRGPRRNAGQLRTARQFLAGGRLNEAETLLRSVLQSDPDNGEALFLLATLAVQNQFYSDAVELLDHALQAEPDGDEYYALKGRALRGMGEAESAVEAYRRALAIRPNAPKVLTSLG